MGLASVWLMVAVVTLGQTEAGWDDVKALLFDDKEARAEASLQVGARVLQANLMNFLG